MSGRRARLWTDEITTSSAGSICEVAQCAAELGGLDILVNNVGGGAGGSLLEATDDDWRQSFETTVLQLEVEDHGKGLKNNGTRPGIGLVGMRERAELLSANLQFSQPAEGGTLVRLRVPRDKCENHA